MGTHSSHISLYRQERLNSVITIMAFEIQFFSVKDYDIESFTKWNTDASVSLHYSKESLSIKNFDAARKGGNVDAICVFVNDVVDDKVLDHMKQHGVKLVLNRCAGFDRVDAIYAQKIGIQCCRVPAYSPYAVAEHAVSLLCCLNRKLHLANNRTSSGNFSIDGLGGMDLHQKTIGVIGTGKIGQILIDIMTGFGCKIAAYDVYVNAEYAEREDVTYMSLEEVYKYSDVISLHTPLLPSTKHMINKKSLAQMKDGVIIINCARGELINTEDLVDALASGKVGGAGLDVYENESGVFFNDCTGKTCILKDRILTALMASSRVIISAHQAFLTEEALDAIATTTLLIAEKAIVQGKKEKELTNWIAPEMATSG